MKVVWNKSLQRRIVSVVLAVIMMGFALSWLVLANMGTDPYTAVNLAIAHKLGISVGNWQAVLNILLFGIVVVWGRKYIGVGTVANMFLVGYSLDFFNFLWGKVLPEGLFDSMVVRIAVLIPSLVVFVIAAAVYMDVRLGTSPYDAIAFILSDRIKKAPLKLVRVAYDVFVIVCAFIFGGNVGLVTIGVAFTLGPAIEWIGKSRLLHKLLLLDDEKQEQA